jgi:hypothetical protein
MYHMTHAPKRVRKLSTAVFRGSRSEYTFDVYPLSTAITDNPVVYIFSRRKVDKLGRWHHAVSCVGETQSIVSEIKKHKRARCVKGSESNVVCIIKEADRRTRSGVLDDIASARAFSCVQGKFKPAIKSKLDVVKNAKPAKILPFKPVEKNVRAADVRVAEPVTGKRKPATKPSTQPEPAKPVKKGKAAAGGKGINSSVDSNGGQHQLSKPKKPVTRTTKARATGGARSRKKRAA